MTKKHWLIFLFSIWFLVSSQSNEKNKLLNKTMNNIKFDKITPKLLELHTCKINSLKDTDKMFDDF